MPVFDSSSRISQLVGHIVGASDQYTSSLCHLESDSHFQCLLFAKSCWKPVVKTLLSLLLSFSSLHQFGTFSASTSSAYMVLIHFSFPFAVMIGLQVPGILHRLFNRLLYAFPGLSFLIIIRFQVRLKVRFLFMDLPGNVRPIHLFTVKSTSQLPIFASRFA